MEMSLTQSIFPSRVIKTRDVSGFQMMEGLYYANTSVPRHSHEQAVFCIALKGRCAEIYGSEVREYQPLTVQFLPPHEAHSLKISSAEVRAFSVEVAPQWLDRTREYSLLLDHSVHSRGGLLSRLFMNLYREFHQMDDASPLAIEGLALEMLAEVSRSQVKVSDSRPRWLAQALDLLREQFSERLTVGHIATSVGVHPVYLARGFRRFCRCTIGEHIRQLRIEHACHELCSSDIPLAAIAYQSHFSRTFKRFMEMTPAQYRRTFSRS